MTGWILVLAFAAADAPPPAERRSPTIVLDDVVVDGAARRPEIVFVSPRARPRRADEKLRCDLAAKVVESARKEPF